MSIKSRVEDAEILWKNGRKEGAWLVALVAAAATSRKRYPQPVSDSQSFKSFIRDVTHTIVQGVSLVESKNFQVVMDQTPLEDIFYKHLRCNLVHEGELATDIQISRSKLVDGEFQGFFAVGPPNVIPDFWVLHLLKAVREAPENASEFTTT